MRKSRTPRVTNECLSRKDVATYLDVTLRTVDNMIADGRLRAYRIGRTVRIRRTDVDAALMPMQEAG